MSEIGKETILGQLRDEGFTPVLVNRVEELLGVFNGNIPQFVAATRGQLNAAYNKLNPSGKMGLGEKTWDVFKRFCAVWRQSQFDAKQTAKAVVEEQERKEAERAEMREQLLERELTTEHILVALDVLEKLGQKTFPLKDLLEFHDRAAKAKGGS